MYYLAADPNDFIFTNNLKVCKGIFASPSHMREVDENLNGMVSPYEIMHADREKEAVFENVRATYYQHLPSRMGAIYLFQDYKAALLANERWWGNGRKLHETIILDGSIFMVVDSEWLNCTADAYKANAHNYFQGKTTDVPLVEVVVKGVVKVSLEPVNA